MVKNTMNIREKIFSRLWRLGAPGVDKKLSALKEKLFQDVQGIVLELGPGTGVNFEYFPSNISWIGIEPNKTLQKILLVHPKRPRNAQLIERIENVQSESIDTAVSSLVLCSVPELEKMLGEVKRVLKKGGAFLCVEHIAAERGTCLRAWQRIIRPFTRLFGGGCEPDREILTAMHNTGFTHIQSSTHHLRLGNLIICVPVIVCSAQK